MNEQEMNKMTLQLLEKKLADEKTSLIIAITLNRKTGDVAQLVGYGVSIEMVEQMFKESLFSLRREIQNKQS